MIIDKSAKRIDFFKELYQKNIVMNDVLDSYYKQYKEGKTNDEEYEVVRNITFELIESQVSTYIPSPKVTPRCWNEKNETNAKNVESMLRNLRNSLPFERLNDKDERFSPIYGGSIWLVEWDNSITTNNSVGDVKVSCLSPKQFSGQPNVYDIGDMEYCFVTFEQTKEDIAKKYGKSLSEVKEAVESEVGDDCEAATVYVCYYKNEEDKVCQYAWLGDLELMDHEDYYSRKIKTCLNCGQREQLCKCANPKYELSNMEEEFLTHDISLSWGGILPAQSEVANDRGEMEFEEVTQQGINADGSVAMEMVGGLMIPQLFTQKIPKYGPTTIPFYKPSILPIVIRLNVSTEDSVLGQSDCYPIRDQQQGVNRIESRIYEKITRAGVLPMIPDTYEGDLENSLYTKPFRVKTSQVKQFGVIDLQVGIQQDTAAADRLYDQAKRILGISDSFQGHEDRTATSGIAKQVQVAQSGGRLQSKKTMKNAAYADIDKIMFQLYLAFADEPRPITFEDEDGRTQNAQFNRYDFVERDELGKYYYNDQFLFATDSTNDIESSREGIWQENRLNFSQGAYGSPQDPSAALIFWQNMEKAHYPFSHENVVRLKKQVEQKQFMEAQMLEATRANEKESASREAYEKYIREGQGGNK